MQVLRLDRTDEHFYTLLGPIFGSRKVEQATRDRFFDDPGKRWYLIPRQGAASVLGHTLRNFWAADEEAADRLIAAIQQDYSRLDGIAPNVHEAVSRRLGFQTSGYRKNFIEVFYEED